MQPNISHMTSENEKGLVFRIEKYMISDGEGIRTNIFFKGCPLRCLWCFNPEGIEWKPEILVFKEKCIQCDECTRACPRNAINLENGYPEIDRGICDVCGECVAACPCQALEICGSYMTIDEILMEIRKDEIFYRRSGGGITLTGGEVCAQKKFAKKLLLACKKEFNTAIETSGFTSWTVFKDILELSDRVFFDLKHMDSQRHKTLTGMKNELILDNLRKASQTHDSITVRIPLVPGLNDSAQNIRETAEFVQSLGTISKIEILPYVNFGISKYEMLGRTYKLPNVCSPSNDLVKDKIDIIMSYGIDCSIVD